MVAHNKLFNDEQEKEICRRHLAGESFGKLATAYNCSVPPIAQALKNQGVQGRSPRYKRTEEDHQEDVDAYLSGESLESIAKRRDVPQSTVRKGLILRGVEMRINYTTAYTPEIHEAILAVLRRGEPMNLAASTVGIDYAIITQWLRLGKEKPHSIFRPFFKAVEEVRSSTEQVVRETISASGDRRLYRGNRRVRQYAVNDAFFDVIEQEPQAYWLGFWTADGNVWGESISCNQAARCETHLQLCKTHLGYTGPLHHYISKPTLIGNNAKITPPRPFVALYIKSKRLAEALIALGVHPNKTFTVRPWQSDNETLLRHYYRGVLDGDGWLVDSDKASMVGLCGNEYIVGGFTEFVRSRLKTKAEPILKGKTWEVCFNGKHLAADIAALLYEDATVALDYKFALAKSIIAASAADGDSRRRGKWDFLTREELLRLREEHGSWREVARQIGMLPCNLYLKRRSVGLA